MENGWEMMKIFFLKIYIYTCSFLLDDNGYPACIWLARHACRGYLGVMAFLTLFYTVFFSGSVCDTWWRADSFLFLFPFLPTSEGKGREGERKKGVRYPAILTYYSTGVYCVFTFYFCWGVCKLEMGG